MTYNRVPTIYSPSYQTYNPQNYPIDALGPQLAAAVHEHHANTGVAVELIASYARSMAHVCCQDNFDVERPGCKPSPISSYDLVAADSGEGKDTAAKPFIALVREYETELSETKQTSRLDELAEKAAWRAEERALKKRLDQAALDGESMESLKEEFKVLMARQPMKTAEVNVIFNNATPGALENALSAGSKSVFITTTEAGPLLNGRLGRATDFLNNAWDSAIIEKDRVADERKVIDDYRLSGHFALQRPVLENVLARMGKNAHDSGLTARLLLTVPHSTLGTRFLQPNQLVTSDRIWTMAETGKALLRQGQHRREAMLDRKVIRFSDASARHFKDIYNYLQAHMANGRALRDISGHAAKTAEQIARIAAALHSFQHREGPLDYNVLESAREIGFWHLDQFFAMFAPGQPGDQRVIDAQVVADALRAAALRGLGPLPRSELKSWCRTELSVGRFNRAVQWLVENFMATVMQRGGTVRIAATWNLMR